MRWPKIIRPSSVYEKQLEEELDAWMRQGIALLENYANRFGKHRV